MIQEILSNETNANISLNSSNYTNLTIRLISEIQITNFSDKTAYSSPWYDSALAGVVLGAIITFFLTFILSWIQRKKELDQYEYKILSKTMKLLNFPTKENEITDFIDEIYLDSKLFEINSNNLVFDSLKKFMRNEPILFEIEQIEKRLDELRKQVNPKLKRKFFAYYKNILGFH